jgi:hypothetical protein
MPDAALPLRARGPHGTGGAWRPLLDGPARDQALEAVGAIADSLRAWSPSPTSVGPPRNGADVASGAAGLAVLYAYLARAFGRPADAAAAARFLGQAVDAVPAKPLPASLYGGFTGVAWAADGSQRSAW